MMKIKHVIGVDEVGRGPLAGPVAVGAVCVVSDFDWGLIPGVNDSKKLTEAKREAIFKLAWQLRQAGQLDWSVAMVSASVIDQKGIMFAIKTAMSRALDKITSAKTQNRKGSTAIYRSTRLLPDRVLVKLDGGLRAPERFIHQETIIKGDSKEKVIGLASILAKVTRDRYMVRLSRRVDLVHYDFATHKGYGTKTHREAIAQSGFSQEHRISYCKSIVSL